MSDTLGKLDAAIQAHISEAFEGELVGAWILVTHSNSVERHTVSNYRIITPDMQPIHTDTGLLHTGERIVQDSWDTASWGDEDDD